MRRAFWLSALVLAGAAQDPKAEFAARTEENRKKAVQRAEAARREVAAEKAVADEAVATLRARLATRPVTVTIRGGETLQAAKIRRFTMNDGDLEAGARTLTLPWDSFEPASLRTAADALFDASAAKEQFERGRFFIARRMWKEALESFDRAAKLGDGYESRVLEFKDNLVRLAAGQGGFRGAARRAGTDTILLGYDWREAKQLEDWAPAPAPAKDSVFIDAKGSVLRGGSEEPLAFEGELAADLRITSPAPVLLGIPGYEIELGPQGATLHRVEKDRRRAVAKSDKAKIVFGKAHEIRLQSKGGKHTVSVDRAEAATLEDPAPEADPPKGPFRIAAASGRLALGAPLLLRGRIAREDLDARLGEGEVLVRRALETDFEEIRERREHALAMKGLGGGESIALTADDPYFSLRITTFSDLVEGYEKLKKELAAHLVSDTPGAFDAAGWERRMSELARKYPDVPSLPFLRALLHDDRQERGLAREALKKALALYPAFAEAILRQAEHLLEAHDAEGALREANRALDAKPDLAAAYVMRARATFEGSPGTMDSWLEDLAVARKLDPGDADAAYFARVLPRQRRGPRDLGCRFDAETAHYLVTTDISAEAAKRYGDALEAAWRHYAETFRDVPLRAMKRKPRVAVFQTAENYHAYFELLSETRGDRTLGVYRDAFNELVLFETLDRAATMVTLFHEAFHHFTSLMVPSSLPYWYNEGMADYMGAIEVADGKVVKKAMVLRDPAAVARLMAESGNLFPFETLMNQTPREFYSAGASLRYSESWSIVHFLHEASAGKHKPLIQAYFNELRYGKTPRQAYDSVFKEKAGALESEWKEYARKLKP